MGAREKDLNPDTYIGLKLPMGYSDSGYFNSLEWKKPTGISQLQSSNIETNIINYINN